jgi:1,4-dihydroxy-2-naphthoyl-CoA synthase
VHAASGDEESAMGYEEIRYAVEDRIATVTLSRPEKLNEGVPHFVAKRAPAFTGR